MRGRGLACRDSLHGRVRSGYLANLRQRTVAGLVEFAESTHASLFNVEKSAIPADGESVAPEGVDAPTATRSHP